MPTILLRDVLVSDLPIFFEQQLDPVANQMAAFSAKDMGQLALLRNVSYNPDGRQEEV